MITVKSVLKEELILHIVIVHQNLLTSKENVNSVTTDVQIVKTLLETVLHVMKTELMPQPVIAQKELSTLMVKPSAQIVKSNVKLVKIMLKTVLSAILITLILQNVSQSHTKENLLKSSISLSDPSKSSLAETVVKIVLDMKTIVKLVLLTDLIHHSVDVLMDTSKMLKKKPVPNVNLVLIHV
jgi:hypothetical protein